MSRAKREELLSQLITALRQSSAEGVIFSQTVAQKVGLNPSDLECLDLLQINGAMLAGQLAELTGLTSGAITGLTDRLERAGFVRREADTRDRRKVLITPNLEKIEAEIGPFYAGMYQHMLELTAKYKDEELAALLDFATQAVLTIKQEVAKLRGDTKLS
jgi:DNA-binding MarR family transcriptional regulator